MRDQIKPIVALCLFLALPLCVGAWLGPASVSNDKPICRCDEKPKMRCECGYGCACAETFLGTVTIGERTVAVMSRTESVFDAKPVLFLDIPDEGTELISITIDLRRRVATRVVYATRKDF
jgi:hypothetical protein